LKSIIKPKKKSVKWASGMHLLGTSWNILYFVRRVVHNELAIKGKSHYTAMLQLVEILTKLACLEL
jgi:hypothetical protein